MDYIGKGSSLEFLAQSGLITSNSPCVFLVSSHQFRPSGQLLGVMLETNFGTDSTHPKLENPPKNLASFLLGGYHLRDADL